MAKTKAKNEQVNNNEITFKIVKRYGVITTYDTGWQKELNLVSWNGNKPKYDIRDWSPSHTSMSRGITLTGTEVKRIIELLA